MLCSESLPNRISLSMVTKANKSVSVEFWQSIKARYALWSFCRKTLVSLNVWSMTSSQWVASNANTMSESLLTGGSCVVEYEGRAKRDLEACAYLEEVARDHELQPAHGLRVLAQLPRNLHQLIKQPTVYHRNYNAQVCVSLASLSLALYMYRHTFVDDEDLGLHPAHLALFVTLDHLD